MPYERPFASSKALDAGSGPELELHASLWQRTVAVGILCPIDPLSDALLSSLALGVLALDFVDDAHARATIS